MDFKRRLITTGDIIDTYYKVKQRGVHFLLSKININNKSRTMSAFDTSAIKSSNWWMIPNVRKRWNYLISKDENINYKQFLVSNFLRKESGIKLLSLGSGSSSHELELATFPQFSEIVCIDLVESSLKNAEKLALANNLDNISFICTDIDKYHLPDNYYDIVLFNASLHHFENVEELLSKRIKDTLKSDGMLVINEYVGPNRLQFPSYQLEAVNKALRTIPPKYKKRFRTNSIVKKFYGSGVIRMIIADPSECIDSAMILPAIHKYYNTIVECPYGGNILMNVLKDISHNFIDLDKEKKDVLDTLFKIEDEYLLRYQSDFVFGIYEINNI